MEKLALLLRALPIFILIGFACSIGLTGWTQTPPAEILPGEPTPGGDPGQPPTAPLYEVKFEVRPEAPTVDDDVTIVVYGFLPDTGNTIADGYATIQENQIELNLEVVYTAPGLEVLTPVRYAFNLGRLTAQAYGVDLKVNGVPCGYDKFEVFAAPKGEPGEPIEPTPLPEPLPQPIYGPYRSQVLLDPVNPAPDQLFSIYLSGVFPTSGYRFIAKEIRTQEAKVFVDVKILEPDVADQVITPFREEIGKLLLEIGTYEIIATVNGKELSPLWITVGDREVIDLDNLVLQYQREGGFAGTVSWVELWDGKHFRRYNGFQPDAGVQSGRVTESLWTELMGSLERCGFAELPEVIVPEIPWADGFVYTVTYRGHTVSIGDGAVLSEPLQEVLNLLALILDTMPPSIDGDGKVVPGEDDHLDGEPQQEPSAVPFWESF